MKKTIALLLSAVLLLSATGCSSAAAPTPPATTTATEAVQATTVATQPTEATEPAAEPSVPVADLPYDYKTTDGMLEITLPNQRWSQVYSNEVDALFSDGACAITVNLYKATQTLPTIPTADDNHKLIFSTAVSADAYILFIVGYASSEADFPDIAKAMNSITLDKTQITKVWPEEAPAAPKYSIAETNYTAWVRAEALNVRSGSGTDHSILCQLSQDTQVTVTGEVKEDGNYIGWSRVHLSNGTVGYVFAQYLTTTKPEPKPTRTGNSKTLYSERGTVYVVYEYSDYNWRTDSGTVYWPASFSTWESSSGHVLYDYDPTVPTYVEPQLTSQSVNLYYGDGSWADIVYLATDGEWYNTNWTNFYPAGNGVWHCGEGTYYDYIPATEPQPQTQSEEDFKASLWAHEGMVPISYETIYEGVYEVTCQNPETGETLIVTWDAWEGSWEY